VELLDINDFESTNAGWFAGPQLPSTRCFKSAKTLKKLKIITIGIKILFFS
jgi:hypothetical protein